MVPAGSIDKERNYAGRYIVKYTHVRISVELSVCRSKTAALACA